MNNNHDSILEKEKQLFDPEYYKNNNKDLNEIQITFEHYHNKGWREGRDPNNWFSTKYYLDKYNDIKKANIDPFYHYLKLGIKEKRSILNNSIETVNLKNKEIKTIELDIIKKSFNADFYKKAYPDIKHIDNPLLHYYLYGWKEGRDPCQDFSTSMFFLANGIEKTYCPLIITEVYPELLKFKTRQSYDNKEEKNYEAIYKSLLSEYKEEIDTCKKLVDNEYYCLKYGIKDHATEHFCIYGYKLNFNPNSWFDTKEYKRKFIEVNPGNINPLYHYIKKGHYINPIQSPIEIKEYNLHKGIPLSISNVVKNYEQYITNPTNKDKTHVNISNTVIQNYIKVLYIKSKVNNLDYELQESETSNYILKKEKIEDMNNMLHWIIPDFGIGGGGHMTIFRTIKYLETKGWKCKIWIINKSTHKNKNDAYDDLIKYYQILKADIDFITIENYPREGNGIICTSWETVEWGIKVRKNQKLFYFVQDYEKLFYPIGSKYLLAEASYTNEINCICASPWLDKIMKEIYGRNSCYFMLGYNKEEYKIMPNIRKFSNSDKKKHIAVYSRIFTERRAVELIIIALHILAQIRSDFVVHFYGGGLELETAPFDYVTHGNLSSEQLCRLYNKCDIGICFSTTNYSLVPQEMMACGLPLLEQEGENTKTIFPSNIVTLAKPTPENIADKICYMLDNSAEIKKTASNAYNWVKNITWNESFKTIEEFIRKNCEIKNSENSKISKNKFNEQNNIKVSVVIPIFNPDSKFLDILRVVCSQEAPWNYEVILIDSSADQNLKNASYTEISNKIQYIKISPKEFQHGRTRNKGVELSRGEFVAFITQDAMPYDSNWLYNLVSVLEKDDEIAIAFGRHYPYPDASPFVKRDITNHFNNLLKQPAILDRNTKIELYNVRDDIWLQTLYFYSDNNSCLKKKYWKKIPMRNVEYGEDQLLAKDMIDAGYKKAYVHQSCVYHSHNFNEHDTFERARIEKHYFQDYFGWDLIKQYKNAQELELVLNNMDMKYAEQLNISDEELQQRFILNKAKALGYFS